jgi:hypothetical protein
MFRLFVILYSLKMMTWILLGNLRMLVLLRLLMLLVGLSLLLMLLG